MAWGSVQVCAGLTVRLRAIDGWDCSRRGAGLLVTILHTYLGALRAVRGRRSLCGSRPHLQGLRLFVIVHQVYRHGRLYLLGGALVSMGI